MSCTSKKAALLKAFEASDKKIIYVKIHRTGSSSVNRCLNGRFPHMAPKYIQRFVSIAEWNNAFKFTFVRGTYDRLVSWFCWNAVGTGNMGPRAWAQYSKFFDKKGVLNTQKERVLAFRRWVEAGCVYHISNPDRHWPGKGKEPRCTHMNHFLPSSVEKLDEWVLDRDGNECLDFIGRFENFEEDLQYVRNKLNPLMDSAHQIPHGGRSIRLADYTKYYDETTRKIVDEIFAKEIARFGFIFGSDNYSVLSTLRKQRQRRHEIINNPRASAIPAPAIHPYDHPRPHEDDDSKQP